MAAAQQQPVSPIAISPTTIVGPTKQQWTTGILGCFSDCGICCTTCCCPCVQFGHNTEAVTGQSKCCIYFLCCCILPCCCVVHAPERTRMREAYNLEPECGCHDCICSIFCQHCSICQEAREIKARGPPQQQKMGGGTQMSPVQTYPQPATPFSPGYPQYAPQGYPQGYPPQPYPPQPYSPQQGYPPQQQYPPQGYPQQQYPPQQYAPQGYPQQQYPPQQYAPSPDAQQAAPVPAQSPPQ